MLCYVSIVSTGATTQFCTGTLSTGGLAGTFGAAWLVAHGALHACKHLFKTGFVTHGGTAATASRLKAGLAAAAARGIFKARFAAAGPFAALGAAAGGAVSLAVCSAPVGGKLALGKLTGTAAVALLPATGGARWRAAARAALAAGSGTAG